MMKMRSLTLCMLGLVLVFLMQGCSLKTHTIEKSKLGKPSSNAEMEALLDQPGPIQLETINSTDWFVPLAGLLNLKSADAIQAGLKDRDEPIQVYAHVLKHPQYGNFIVDTGVSKKLLDDPGLDYIQPCYMQQDPSAHHFLLIQSYRKA